MLTVEEYCKVRIAHRDGMSVRQIARRFNHSRRKVREVLAESEPRPYTLRQDRPAPRLGPYKALIEQILAEDEQTPRKQQHTAAKLYRRLRDEHGYAGGYDQVRRYVGRLVRDRRETFIPLTHPPGRRLEADLGHIYVDFPDGRRQVSVLLLTWSHSGFRFALALPSERTEAILAGMVEGFAFFGCVPWEVWWDNPTTVATAVLGGRQRKAQSRHAALASHYCFDPRFCMPARGNEKPYVEHSVYDLQRDWATPVPRAEDLAELNAYLRSCALAIRVNPDPIILEMTFHSPSRLLDEVRMQSSSRLQYLRRIDGLGFDTWPALVALELVLVFLECLAILLRYATEILMAIRSHLCRADDFRPDEDV